LLDAEQRVCLELLRMAQPDPAYLDNMDAPFTSLNRLICDSL